MTIRFDRDARSGLVVADIEQSVPVADIRDFLSGVASHPDHRATDPILVRVGSLDEMPPLTDIRLMISALRGHRAHFRGPIAVVTPDLPIMISARMAASLCQLAGFQVQVFPHDGDARHWLADQQGMTPR